MHFLIHSPCIHMNTSSLYRVRRYNHSKTVVLNTYGFQVYRKAKGPSIRQSNRNGSNQNLYVKTSAVEMKDIDTEPIIRVHTSSLVEREEEEEEETEMFANKAATESENGDELWRTRGRDKALRYTLDWETSFSYILWTLDHAFSSCIVDLAIYYEYYSHFYVCSNL